MFTSTKVHSNNLIKIRDQLIKIKQLSIKSIEVITKPKNIKGGIKLPSPCILVVQFLFDLVRIF